MKVQQPLWEAQNSVHGAVEAQGEDCPVEFGDPQGTTGVASRQGFPGVELEGLANKGSFDLQEYGGFH